MINPLANIYHSYVVRILNSTVVRQGSVESVGSLESLGRKE
jgi:hypothetical protein